MENSIILHGLTPNELFEMIRKTVREEINSTPPKPEENYKTRQETAKRLNISLPTLWEYTKRGIIKSSRIGSRVLYSESDIIEAIKSIPNLKNSRP